MLVIAVSVASEVLNWGSVYPDRQDDRVWHGLPPHLWLLGHPFD